MASDASDASEPPDSTPTPPPVAVDLPLPPSPPARRGARSAAASFRPAAGPSGLRRLTLALLGAALVACVLLPGAQSRAVLAARRVGALAVSALRASVPAALAAKGLAPAPGEGAEGGAGGARAPIPVKHEGYASIPGGVLFLPETFSTVDGTYDIVLHFHGNVRVVLEGAELAKLNAAVAIVNLGIGSAPYQDLFAAPGSYEALLADIDRAVKKRGVPEPRRRRVALSAWSAGYGSLSTMLEFHRNADGGSLDALLVADGIHAGWLAEAPGRPNHRQLAPFAAAARDAAEGRILFSITHSEIDPVTYVGTRETAAYLLRSVGAEPAREGGSAPPHLELASAVGAVSKRLEKRLEPTGETRAGLFRVRGFRGVTKEHHAAHLFQMGATVFRDLAERWNAPAR